jgi:hypothetical protein
LLSGDVGECVELCVNGMNIINSTGLQNGLLIG